MENKSSSYKRKENEHFVFILNLIFTILELISGVLFNSAVILADSIHGIGDSITLSIANVLEKKSNKKADNKYTYGYKRFQALGMLINSSTLLLCCAVSITTGIYRLLHMRTVQYNGVLLIAIIGLIINLICAFKIRNSTRQVSKTIYLHAVEDTLAWLIVLVLAIIMKLYNLPILDPIMSIGISAYILTHAFKYLSNLISIFLEKAPNTINVDTIKYKLIDYQLIRNIPDIHIWTLDGSTNYCTMHIQTIENVTIEQLKEIKEFVRNALLSYSIENVTIDIDFEET